MVSFKVKATYLFPNQMIATFDLNGKQISDLQGKYSIELHEKIIARSNNYTEWYGMPNYIKPITDIYINEMNYFDLN